MHRIRPELSVHSDVLKRASGGMRVDQARRLKTLEKENGRLNRLLADLALDNPIFKEVTPGNF